MSASTSYPPSGTKPTTSRKNVRPASRSPPLNEPTTSSNAPAGSSSKVADKEKRPAAKRARKAVNCEPCRTNKLKCDRNRPCSSCELRGTVSQCYQESRLADPIRGLRDDPYQELSKIRKSLSSLEQFIRHTQPTMTSPEVERESVGSPDVSSLHLMTPIDESRRGSLAFGSDELKPFDRRSAPGARGRQAGGIYAGPTSASSHLIGSGDDDDIPSSPLAHLGAQSGYDKDILGQMPDNHTVDSMIDYYFQHCQWIYRHVWERSFRARWGDFKNGHSTDELVLATCCGILALTTIYMPEEHPLKKAVVRCHGANPSKVLFDLMKLAHLRYENQNKGYSLELAELVLLKAHYLLHATQDGEEIWTIKGQLVTLATAMGLHRDPNQWRMSPEVAERRRWLWWHILAYERWQSFLLGRPPSISAAHFDTQLPSAVCDPAQDPTGTMYHGTLALFRLVVVVGPLIDDALSLRPVPYAQVQKHDQALLQWMAELPPEWNLSESQIQESLSSNAIASRRLAVQLMCIRGAFYHIRFTLHRPYAARPMTPLVGLGVDMGSSGSSSGTPEAAQSAEIAATTAEQLIALANQCRMGSTGENLFAVPGHLAFHPFHLFSAAMFFSFQLIAAPTGPSADRFKQNIHRATEALRSTPANAPGGRIAANGLQILDALAPLWADDFVRMPPGPEKAAQKQAQLTRVRALAFPFHESAASRGPDHPANPTGPRDERSNSFSAPPGSAGSGSSIGFGSQGTLMPDMSYSGRSPITFASVSASTSYAFPDLLAQQQQQQQQEPSQPMGPPRIMTMNMHQGYGSEPSSSTSVSAPWPLPHAQTAPAPSTRPAHQVSQPEQSRRVSVHEPPASASGSASDYWSYGTQAGVPDRPPLSAHVPMPLQLPLVHAPAYSASGSGSSMELFLRVVM